MSITLNDLLDWRDRLSEQSGEEAQMVRALIARREVELRARIADLIATVSQLENWKLQRCAAIARRVEQASIAQLEAVFGYFRDRSEGRAASAAPPELAEFFRADPPASGVPDAREEAFAAAAAPLAPAALPAQIADLHGLMRSLESQVASAPGLPCGIQGVRIMRMVALMSKARSAQIARMRMSGTQAFYRHS